MSRVRLLPVGLLLLALICGCSDDCPVCPIDNDEPETPSYKGWLYYVDAKATNYDLYVVDTETDSIADSLTCEDPGFFAGAVGVSPDGRYLALGCQDFGAMTKFTQIYDAQTLAPIGQVPGNFMPLFDSVNNLLVRASGVDIGLYDVPSFAPVYEGTMPFALFAWHIDEKRQLLYGSGDDLYIYTYDYANRRLAGSIHIVPWPGDTCVVYAFCLNREATRIYYRAASHRDTHLGCYDIASKQVLYTFSTPSQYGGIAVSPDDRQVYFTDWGPPRWIGYTGTVYILDAATGTYLQGISLYGYSEYPMVAPLAHAITFTPDGSKAYVACGPVAKHAYPATGAVFAIDTGRRDIVNVIPRELDRWPLCMAIGPKQ